MVRPTKRNEERKAEEQRAQTARYAALCDEAMTACKADPFFSELAEKYQPAYILYDDGWRFDLCRRRDTDNMVFRTKITLLEFHLCDLMTTDQGMGVQPFLNRFAEYYAPGNLAVRQILADRHYINTTLDFMNQVLRWAERQPPVANQSAA